MESILVLTELPFWGHFPLLPSIQDSHLISFQNQKEILYFVFVFEMFPRLAQIPGLRGPSALT